MSTAPWRGRWPRKRSAASGWNRANSWSSACASPPPARSWAGWLALERGIACNGAGGSHHAAHGHGAGYCIFNDVAVAIRNLQAQGAVARAMVIDADVHQGDGTAEIFRGDDSVFTVSIHAEKNFPVRKQPSDLDVGPVRRRD